MVFLFPNLVEAVQLFNPKSILVVNLAVNRKAGDFIQFMNNNRLFEGWSDPMSTQFKSASMRETAANSAALFEHESY